MSDKVFWSVKKYYQEVQIHENEKNDQFYFNFKVRLPEHYLIWSYRILKLSTNLKPYLDASSTVLGFNNK